MKKHNSTKYFKKAHFIETSSSKLFMAPSGNINSVFSLYYSELSDVKECNRSSRGLARKYGVGWSCISGW